ncbi:MAG: short-chain dehydrogenase [Rhodospirillaceae bacterium]|nr:short-chain dehydrogenase [Rhodospirillaceae bacterium]|tara:strand:- start:2818 stop:3654 length:837 start_codon:yes stop_codon:yes gene_type:complete
MDDTISGKVAVITGGGRGLGKAMALGLVSEGAKVAITASREGQELDQTAKECKKIGGEDCVLTIQADVSDYSKCKVAVEKVISQWGSINILINNAGRGMTYVDKDFVKNRPKLWDIQTESWKMIVDTNLNGIFNMSKLTIPIMIKEGWGRIINISTSLMTMQRKGYSPYGSTKWAVEGLTCILAQDLEETNITANILIPGGATDTAMIPGDVGDKSRTGADGNLFEPDIMVKPSQYLASELSDGKNGLRFVAKLWDNEISIDEAANNSSFDIKRNRTY